MAKRWYTIQVQMAAIMVLSAVVSSPACAGTETITMEGCHKVVVTTEDGGSPVVRCVSPGAGVTGTKRTEKSSMIDPFSGKTLCEIYPGLKGC